MRIATTRELAENTGKAKGSLMRWIKKPWFPERGGDGCWDLQEVLDALEDNVRKRGASKDRPKPSSKRAAASSPKRPSMTIDKSLEHAQGVLDSETSSTVAICQAVMHIAVRELSSASRNGEIQRKDIENAKNAIDQMRQAEKAYLEIEEKKGRLISKDVAKAVSWKLSKRFRSVLDLIRVNLSRELLIMTDNAELVGEVEKIFRSTADNAVVKDLSELEQIIQDERERQGKIK